MSWKSSSRWVICGLALCCFGQEIQWTGPTAGMFYDQPSRSLRQVIGMPGAARLSGAVLSDVDWGSVSPDGRTALFLKQGSLRVLSLKAAAADAEGAPVEGVIEAPALAAWLNDSSAAVLYLPASQSLQWVHVTGSPMAAEAAVALAGVEGAVTKLCAGGDASFAVFAVAGAGVYRASSQAGVSLIASVADVSALAMDGAGKTLWIADRSNAKLLQATNLADTPAVETLLADPERLPELSALTLSSNGKTLYLADRSTRRLYAYDRSSGALSEGLDLDVPATGISRLGSPSVFLLGQREKTGEPLYLLDDSISPAVYFVPAGEGR